MTKRIPHAYTIIVFAILFCAILSLVIPAGQYERETVLINGVEKTVIVEGSFHLVERSPQIGRYLPLFSMV